LQRGGKLINEFIQILYENPSGIFILYACGLRHRVCFLNKFVEELPLPLQKSPHIETTIITSCLLGHYRTSSVPPPRKAVREGPTLSLLGAFPRFSISILYPNVGDARWNP